MTSKIMGKEFPNRFRDLTRVSDFQDYNYERIAFEIGFFNEGDRKALEEQLKVDLVNKTYRLENANYFAIWNSDLQDFKYSFDIYFDSDKYDYILARLYHIDGEWYYEIADVMMVDERVRYN